MSEANGAWSQFRQFQEEKFSSLETILEQGFAKLDKRLENLSDSMVDVLVGKDVISVKTHQEILSGQADSYARIIKTMAWAFGLILVVLVGLKAALPQTLMSEHALSISSAIADSASK